MASISRKKITVLISLFFITAAQGMEKKEEMSSSNNPLVLKVNRLYFPETLQQDIHTNPRIPDGEEVQQIIYVPLTKRVINSTDIDLSQAEGEIMRYLDANYPDIHNRYEISFNNSSTGQQKKGIVSIADLNVNTSQSSFENNTTAKYQAVAQQRLREVELWRYMMTGDNNRDEDSD